MSRTVCQGLTVLRINRWWGPIRPTTLNFCLSNIDSVPNQNQLDHFDHAFADLCVTGYASTTPPPLALIELRAAVRATFATPFLRWSLSTKKHVIRHSFSGSPSRFIRR